MERRSHGWDMTEAVSGDGHAHSESSCMNSFQAVLRPDSAIC